MSGAKGSGSLSTPWATTTARLATSTGRQLGPTTWRLIEQERIQLFADATDDHQWIHLDRDRAARQSPYGTTIAHGFLTLSLLSAFGEELLDVTDASMAINYGLNRVRFPAPAPVGCRVRATATIDKVSVADIHVEVLLGFVLESDMASKPVCVAESVSRFYTAQSNTLSM